MRTTNDRDAALRAAWESVRDRWLVSHDEFAAFVSGWDVEPVQVRGDIVGAILTRGPEIHACIKPEGFGRWLSRAVLRRTVGKAVEMHGYAETRVTTGNAAGEAFVRRLGFLPVATENGVTRYRYGH